MSVKINLINGFWLTSDSKQWVISKEKKGCLKGISYHMTIEQALISLADDCLRVCNAKSIQELLQKQKSLLAVLSKACAPLKIVR